MFDFREMPGLYFDADTGDGGGTGTDTGDATGGSDGGNEVQFTPEQQAHIDKFIGARLAKAREKWDTAQSENQKKAEEEAERQRLADEAKWQELAEQAEAKVAELQATVEKSALEVRERTIRAAFLTHAAKLGAVHPGDAYALSDLSEVNLDDDGNASGVEEQVKALVESGRLPTSTRPAPSLDGGAGGGSPRDTTAPEVSDEEVQEFAARFNVKPEHVDRALLAQMRTQ